MRSTNEPVADLVDGPTAAGQARAARQGGDQRPLRPGEASVRAVLAATGVGAGVVLQASWGTVKPQYAAALTLVAVVGVVHGVLGWARPLGIPARVSGRSLLAYALVLASFALLTEDRLGTGAASLLWARLGIGIVLATAVHWVAAEAGGPRRVPGWRRIAVLALLPGLLGATVLGAYGRPGSTPEEGIQLAMGGQGPGAPDDVAEALTFPADGPTAVPPTTARREPSSVEARPATTAARAAPATKRSTTKQATSTSVAPATSTPTTVAPPRAVKLLISGESTAGATGGGIRTWGQANGRAEVEVVGSNGCALQQDGVAILREGWTQPKNGACSYLIDYTIEMANRTKPDMIILFIGSNQLSDWLLPGETVARAIGEPGFDQLYTNAARAALGKLGALGIPVLFTSTPVPSWDPAVQTGDPNVPGTGPIKMNDAGRARRLNDLTAAVVRSLPLTAVAPYAERISNPDGTVPTSIRPDGVHLRQEAVPAIMDRGLEADLRSSYLQVTARVPAAARGSAHHWSQA